jgi:hypothetical protein
MWVNPITKPNSDKGGQRILRRISRSELIQRHLSEANTEAPSRATATHPSDLEARQGLAGHRSGLAIGLVERLERPHRRDW